MNFTRIKLLNVIYIHPLSYAPKGANMPRHKLVNRYQSKFMIFICELVWSKVSLHWPQLTSSSYDATTRPNIDKYCLPSGVSYAIFVYEGRVVLESTISSKTTLHAISICIVIGCNRLCVCAELWCVCPWRVLNILRLFPNYASIVLWCWIKLSVKLYLPSHVDRYKLFSRD